MAESYIDNKIPVCKCVNGPIKDDIVLNKKYNSNRNKYKDSNNLSTNSINNWKTTTSQNNVISDVINDDLAAPKWKNKFPINTTPLKLGSTEAEFNKRKKILSNISQTWYTR